MSPTSTTTSRATLADLARTPGKAELVGGRIVILLPTGFRPGQVGGRVYRSLDDHASTTGLSVALPDNVGFAVPELRSGRESFAPDASYFLGSLPDDEMDFIPGPPTFAVEVRSKGDAADAAIADKRADYFEAGTLVVWDVDPRACLIRSYRSDAPGRPSEFAPGWVADAEPAVPGWRVAVDDLLA